jgi:Proteobacterial transcriptional regulator-like domain
MPHFDWRSPEAYDRAKALESTDFAWEFLRRNPDYQNDFDALPYATPDPIMITAFRRKWGLCFRC